MCIRLGTCCGLSLRKGAIVVGAFTFLETLGLIIAGGVFLNYGFHMTDVGGPTGYVRLPYKFDHVQAFGALYLAFGALWLVCFVAYVGAIWAERPLYLLPWLVLQAITLGLALANMITDAAIRQYNGLGIIPLFFLYIFFYVIVFSYYLDLQEQKQIDKARTYRY